MLAVAFGLFSCNEDNRVFDKTAAAGIAGTYTGTWKMVDDKGNESETQGTVTFAEIEGQTYQALMTIDAAGIGYTATCHANVAHAEDDYVFYNNQAVELLPEDAPEDATIPQFQGRVKTDGSTFFDFSIKSGKGKKAKTTKYTFAGAR